MGQYQELRTLNLRGGIKAVTQSEAAAYLRGSLGAEPEPSRGSDLDLLGSAQDSSDPLPLLCLRCRISHALEAWLLVTFRAHQRSTGIELEAMASYALDDDGLLTIRTGPNAKEPFTYAQVASMPKGLISPFSAEVLRSYDSALCGLPHWARLKIQSHNELKAYFRQYGLLLISDWALLRNSSPTRVRQACEQHLRSGDTIETLCGLHGRYAPLYDAAKLVHAHNFIQKLPQGYETAIGEHGEQLDAGQAFRLGLARAMLRKPALLIIEEPPSSLLDDETKQLIDDAYLRIAPGRTVIYIPSRLTTIRRCDPLVFIHKGKLEAVGPRSRMIQHSPLYQHWEYLNFNEFRHELEPQASG